MIKNDRSTRGVVIVMHTDAGALLLKDALQVAHAKIQRKVDAKKQYEALMYDQRLFRNGAGSLLCHKSVVSFDNETVR